MDTYKFKVTLEVVVEAFDHADAIVVLQDNFGEGDLGVIVIEKMTAV